MATQACAPLVTCFPGQICSRSLAKVSRGAMLNRLFANSSACAETQHPDTEKRPRGLLASLRQVLSNASSAETSAIVDRAHTLIQTAIDSFEASKYSGNEKDELLQGLLAMDLPVTMLLVLPNLEFEAKKCIIRLFHKMVQQGAAMVFEYVGARPAVLQLLISGCGKAEVALHCHMMLKSCTESSQLAACMLEAGFATELLKLARHKIFDISSDAFSSLRALLLANKEEAVTYLEDNFDNFFTLFSDLVQKEDYVAKRQGLRLLAEILLDRSFRRIMLRYVQQSQFLQVSMILLKDNSKAVQHDAFQVFKVFAGVPTKSRPVHQILFKNRERLVKLIGALGADSDAAFLQDQEAVINALWALKAL